MIVTKELLELKTQVVQLRQIVDDMMSIQAAPPADQRLWTAKQAADYLGVSTKWFRDKVSLLPDFPGKIDIEGQYRWLSGDVMAWVKSKR